MMPAPRIEFALETERRRCGQSVHPCVERVFKSEEPGDSHVGDPTDHTPTLLEPIWTVVSYQPSQCTVFARLGLERTVDEILTAP
jgi:hypothetical protein